MSNLFPQHPQNFAARLTSQPTHNSDYINSQRQSPQSPQYNSPSQQYNLQQQDENPNTRKYHEFGYSKMDDLKIDYRQKINNKLDNLIFDNVGNQFPPMIPLNPYVNFTDGNGNGNGSSLYNQSGGQSGSQSSNNRYHLQEKSRSLYKDQANERMSQYSPLARAANIPVEHTMSFQNNSSFNPYQPVSNTRELLSSRMSQYSPLARTISLDTKDTNGSGNISGANNINEYKQKIYEMQQKMQTNLNDSNINKGLKNMVYDQYPVNSN